MALQDKLHNFKVEGGVLTLHVGVASGSVAGIYVGGVRDRVEFLISGEALDMVSSCEKGIFLFWKIEFFVVDIIFDVFFGLIFW